MDYSIGHFGVRDDPTIRFRKFFDEIRLYRLLRSVRLQRLMRSMRPENHYCSILYLASS